MANVINARIRQGVPPDSANLPWAGCVAGRRIAGEHDVADLWQAIEDIRKRRRAWLRVIQADEFPKISSLKPESDYTGDEAPPIDLRTDEERENSAESAWNAVFHALYSVDPLLVRYIEQVVIRDLDVRGPPLAMVLRLKPLRAALGY